MDWRMLLMTRRRTKSWARLFAVWFLCSQSVRWVQNPSRSKAQLRWCCTVSIYVLTPFVILQWKQFLCILPKSSNYGIKSIKYKSFAKEFSTVFYSSLLNSLYYLLNRTKMNWYVYIIVLFNFSLPVKINNYEIFMPERKDTSMKTGVRLC